MCVAVCEGDLDFGFDRGGGRGLLILLLLLLFLVRLDWILSVLLLARSAFFALLCWLDWIGGLELDRDLVVLNEIYFDGKCASPVA